MELEDPPTDSDGAHAAVPTHRLNRVAGGPIATKVVLFSDDAR